MKSKRNSRVSKAAANSDSAVSATTGAQKKKRGRPKKSTSKGGGKPPVASTPRTTRSTRASARTPSPAKRASSLRLRGDDPNATCISRCHPSNLICVGCGRNEEQRNSASRSYKEHPCSRLWIESNCKSSPDHRTYALIKEWEEKRTSVSVPTLERDASPLSLSSPGRGGARKQQKTRLGIFSNNFGTDSCSAPNPNTRLQQMIRAIEGGGSNDDEDGAGDGDARMAGAVAEDGTVGRMDGESSGNLTTAPGGAAGADGGVQVGQTGDGTGNDGPSSISSSPAGGVSTESLPPTFCPGIYSIGADMSDVDAVRLFPYLLRQIRATASELSKGLSDNSEDSWEKLRDWIGTGKMLLPSNGCVVDNEDGVIRYRAEGCDHCKEPSALRCGECTSRHRSLKEAVRRAAAPLPDHRTTPQLNIEYLAEDPAIAADVIRHERAEKIRERRLRMKLQHELRISVAGKTAEKEVARGVILAMSEADKHAAEELGEDSDERELWKIHMAHLGRVAKRKAKGKGMQGIRYDPVMLDLAVCILAKTSRSTYEMLRETFLLPDPSHVYRLSAKLVTTNSSKTRQFHDVTLSSMNDTFIKMGFPIGSFERVGKLSFDAVNANETIEHDAKSGLLVGLDQSMKYSNVRKKFMDLTKSLRESKDDEEDESNESEETEENAIAEDQPSIIDNSKTASQHLCFRWTSLDPAMDMSHVVATVDVSCVTPEVVSAMAIEVIDELAATYGLDTAGTCADDAGENAKFANAFSTLKAKDYIDDSLTGAEEFSSIDFSVKVALRDSTTGEVVVLLPDMPHLLKNIVTAMELSSKPSSKRDLKYGDNPINLNAIKDPWEKTGGKSNQQHPTKLGIRHFEKDQYSRMKVYLAAQVLSNSVVEMIKSATRDASIKLSLSKPKYCRLIEFIEKMDALVDLCNGRDRKNFSPTNARDKQKELLSILAWFSDWEKDHRDMVKKGKANEYNFFAPSTWKCIQRLILGLCVMIEELCIKKQRTIVPRRLNTDDLENHFANCRQFVGGSHDKLTCRGWLAAHAKASKFKFGRRGNNAFSPLFARRKRYIL